MSIYLTRKNRAFLSLSGLVIFLILFSACSSGSTSGIEETDPSAEVFVVVNHPDFSDFPVDPDNPLVLCALNSLVLTANTTDGKPIIRYRVTLTAEPDATAPTASGLPASETDSGFMLNNTDYYAAVQNTLDVPTVDGQGVVYLKAALPSSLGVYDIEVMATADGSFTDYPSPFLLLGLTTQGNPCLKSFSDDGDNQGTAAAAALDLPAVDGETVTILGYNLSTNPDIFFFLDDKDGDGIEDPEDGRYPLTNITEISIASGLYELEGDVAPGCGVDTDFCVENGNPSDTYADYSVIDTGQRRPGQYTYLPIITGMDNDGVSPAEPDASCTGGDTVRIYGGGFLHSYNSTDLTSTIDGNLAAVNFGSSDCGMLVVTTPAFTGTDPDNTWVVVNNPDGNSDTWGDDYPSEEGFTYNPECYSISSDAAGLVTDNTGVAGDTRYINGCGFASDVTVSIQQRNGSGGPNLTLDAVSSTQIRFTVPGGAGDAGQGRIITVTNPSSSSPNNEATACTFNYLPNCTSISPTSGQGGVDTVVITGTGFDTDTNVTIGGNSVSTAISVPDANTISFTTPCGANDYGQGRAVRVIDVSSGAWNQCGLTFDFEPICGGLNPTHGQRNAEITITGCGFDTNSVLLTIGSTLLTGVPGPPVNPGEYYVANGNTIYFRVPDGPNDYGQGVTVEITDILAIPDTTCTFDFDPLCSGITAANHRPGQSATISGYGFDTDSTVNFGAMSMTRVVVAPASAGEYQIVNGNSISLWLPTTTTDPADFGDVSVVITDDSITAYTEDTSCGAFRYYPTCTGIDDGSQPHYAGNTVTITGTGFAPEDTITFGHATMTAVVTPTNPGDYSVDNANEITVIVPCDYNDPYSVNVEVTDGNVGTQSCTTPPFVYDPYVDCVTGISPLEGAPAGNTAVTITGCGFDDDVDISIGSIVLADDASCPPADGEIGKYCRDASMATNAIYLRTPVGSGVETITISNPTSGGTHSDCEFTYQVTCTSVISVPGYFTYNTKARVTGGGFGNKTKVFFGYGANTGDTADDLELTAGVDGSPTDDYPEVAGTFFIYDNGTPADPSDDEIRLNLPCGGPNDPYGGNLVPIRIVNKGQGNTTTESSCSIDYEEHCDSLTADDLPCGAIAGSPIEIAGCGFDDTETYTVEFGDAAASVTATVGDSNTLNITTVPNGPVAAADPDGDGAVDISVSPCPDGSCDPIGTFDYQPSCGSITPDTAAFGDPDVNISGCGFADGADVSIGSTLIDSLDITYNNYGSLDVPVPGGANDAGTDVTVDVGNPNGQSCSSTLTFTFEPAVTAVTPDTGPLAGGMSAVVGGYGFQGGASVAFTGNSDTVTVDSVGDANTINITSPAWTGTPPGDTLPEAVNVTVTNPGPLSSDACTGCFTFDSIPIITSIYRIDGPEAGGTNVDIEGFQLLTVADGATVTFGAAGDAVSYASRSDTLIDDAQTPPGVGLGTVGVTVTDTDTTEVSDPVDFTYKDRNVDGGYTIATLNGDYNFISIWHDFGSASDSTDDEFITTAGNGALLRFDGSGVYSIDDGVDEFTVTNDGTDSADPSTTLDTNVTGVASSSYLLDNDGMLRPNMETDLYLRGFLTPDANALFVASTQERSDRANELVIGTRVGNSAVSLDGMTMGVVAFVHDYGHQDLIAAGVTEVIYSFQGTATFTGTNFSLTPLTQSRNAYLDNDPAPDTIDTTTSTGDASNGSITFVGTTGRFTLAFAAASTSAEEDLFDGDVIEGIFTVTDDAGPQLFAGVNLSSQASSPGRSILLIMVPLVTSGQDATSVGGEEDDTGWSQGVFGHEFEALLSAYLTSYARVSYDSDTTTYSESNVYESVVRDSGQTAASFPVGSSFAYGVATDGALTVSPPTPSIEGFVSADDSVTAGVDASPTTINTIRLELTR